VVLYVRLDQEKIQKTKIRKFKNACIFFFNNVLWTTTSEIIPADTLPRFFDVLKYGFLNCLITGNSLLNMVITILEPLVLRVNKNTAVINRNSALVLCSKSISSTLSVLRPISKEKISNVIKSFLENVEVWFWSKQKCTNYRC